LCVYVCVCVFFDFHALDNPQPYPRICTLILVTSRALLQVDFVNNNRSKKMLNHE